MQKTLPIILALLILFGCDQTNKQKNKEAKDSFFQFLIYPSFDEYAEVTITKNDSVKQIQVLIWDNYRLSRPQDTFYFKAAALSESQVQKIDSELIRKAITMHSIEKPGMRDGISFAIRFLNNGDTSTIDFNNPEKKTDSLAFALIESGIGNFRAILNDTIVNEYFDDMESYIYNTYMDTAHRNSRSIMKLRKLRYSRQN